MTTTGTASVSDEPAGTGEPSERDVRWWRTGAIVALCGCVIGFAAALLGSTAARIHGPWRQIDAGWVTPVYIGGVILGYAAFWLGAALTNFGPRTRHRPAVGVAVFGLLALIVVVLDLVAGITRSDLLLVAPLGFTATWVGLLAWWIVVGQVFRECGSARGVGLALHGVLMVAPMVYLSGAEHWFMAQPSRAVTLWPALIGFAIGAWLCTAAAVLWLRSVRHGWLPGNARDRFSWLRAAGWCAFWFVPTALVVGAVGWLVAAPVPYDEAFYDSWAAVTRADVPPEQNAWHDYHQMTDHGLSADCRDTIDSLGDSRGVRHVDLQPFRDRWAAARDVRAIWAAARTRPVDRGDWSLDFGTDHEAPIADIVGPAGLRLVATIDEPSAFADSVAAVRHAAVTLSDHGTLVDAATATVLVGLATDCIRAHLAIERPTLTPAHRQVLAGECDRLTAVADHSLAALYLDRMQFRWAVEHDARHADGFPDRTASRVASSRMALVSVDALKWLAKDDQRSNAQWRERRVPDFTRRAYEQLTPWQRLRCGEIWYTFPVGFGELLQSVRGKARSIRTRMRLLRLAFAVEGFAAAHGQLPRSLGNLDVEPAWLVDDWSGEQDYHYHELILLEPGEPGYVLRSIGWPDGDRHDYEIVVPPVPADARTNPDDASDD